MIKINRASLQNIPAQNVTQNENGQTILTLQRRTYKNIYVDDILVEGEDFILTDSANASRVHICAICGRPTVMYAKNCCGNCYKRSLHVPTASAIARKEHATEVRERNRIQREIKEYFDAFPNNVLRDIYRLAIYTEAKAETFTDEECSRVTYIVAHLPEGRDREMFLMRYQQHITLIKIGDKYGITRERVRQRINKTLFNIARQMYAPAKPEPASTEADGEDSIDTLPLSTRANNALHRANIHTIERLRSIPIDTLAGYKGIGVGIVCEIENALRQSS